ncbi:FBD-associated F-box protein At5g38590 [Linum grandiflorum]
MIQNRSIDRLSDLPDCILHHILSFLDTRSSVQTGILSRRWISLWKYVHTLNFSTIWLRSNSGFERFVERVLSLRSDRISVTRVTADFGDNGRKDAVDRIIKYAASHGVQELFISTYFVTSAGVFESIHASYRSLKVLELELTSIDNNDVGLWSCFQLLESLTLTFCDFTFVDGAAIDGFANFPRLENLKLVNCYDSECRKYFGTSVLKVTGPKLLNLEIVWPLFNRLEIVAPKLQSFSLKIDCSCTIRMPREVSKSNLPSLHRANVELLGDTSSRYNDAMKRWLIEGCVNLFEILHNVQVLNLQVETFELLNRTCNSAKHQFPRFTKMKSLNLKVFEECSDISDEVIRYFLGGSPDEDVKRFTVEKLCQGR